jgi:hypothetical protein
MICAALESIVGRFVHRQSIGGTVDTDDGDALKDERKISGLKLFAIPRSEQRFMTSYS